MEVGLQGTAAADIGCPAVEATTQRVGMANVHLDRLNTCNNKKQSYLVCKGVRSLRSKLELRDSPRLSNILWMVLSLASTITRFSSSISTFMDSHLEDIHRGWSAEGGTETSLVCLFHSAVCFMQEKISCCLRTHHQESEGSEVSQQSSRPSWTYRSEWKGESSDVYQTLLQHLSTGGQHRPSTSPTWWHGRSGFDSTSPGPMMLKVASMCMGLGSLNEIMWIL